MNFPPMSHQLYANWVRFELIPFLQMVFNEGSGHMSRSWTQWEMEVNHAAIWANTIRNYDNSMISIDRIRLTLLSPDKVSTEDREQANKVMNNPELVTGIFVRRALNHGPYPIVSLGVEQSPVALQERAELRNMRKELPQVILEPIRSNRSGRRRSASDNKSKRSHIPPGRNQRHLNRSSVFPELPDYPSAAYTAESMIPILNPEERHSEPSIYNESHPGVHDHNSASTTPTGPVSNSGYELSPVASNVPSEPYVGTSEPASLSSGQVPRSSTHRKSAADAPVLVSGNRVNNTRYAPEFVPGRQEHKTLHMMKSVDS